MHWLTNSAKENNKTGWYRTTRRECACAGLCMREREKMCVIMRECVGARAQQEVGRNGRDYMWVCVRIKRKRYRESVSVTVCNRKGGKKEKERKWLCVCACMHVRACERVCVCAHWVDFHQSLINLSNRRNRKKKKVFPIFFKVQLLFKSNETEWNYT